jgi:hypothetical protein
MLMWSSNGKKDKPRLKCVKHPNYKGKAQPTSDCIACWRIRERRGLLEYNIYTLQQLLKEITG